MNLSGALLVGADLSRSIFRHGVDLSHANLSHANLENVTFSGGYLEEQTFPTRYFKRTSQFSTRELLTTSRARAPTT